MAVGYHPAAFYLHPEMNNRAFLYLLSDPLHLSPLVAEICYSLLRFIVSMAVILQEAQWKRNALFRNLFLENR